MRKLFLGLMAVVFCATVTGCNAMKGAGKDVEATGQNIQETVEKNN